MTLNEKIDDLILQATTERSHYYTANTLREAKARIARLEAVLRDLMAHEPDHPDTVWQEARAALEDKP